MAFYQEREAHVLGNEEGEVEMCDAEIFDELTTSRGELKVRTVSFSEEKNTLRYSGFFTPEKYKEKVYHVQE